MSDLANRLRGETMPLRDLRTTRRNEVLCEAANHIEKLEAALRKYADEEYNGYNADGAHARKALEGKDE